jgi:branched-subunit amino acid transport protein
MVLSRLNIPAWAMRWLNYVPVAVMAALVGQELLLSDGKFSLHANSAGILAALPAFLVALFTRSLLGTVVTGILAMLLLRLVY